MIERVNSFFLHTHTHTLLQKAFCYLIKRFVMELCACGLFILL